jgi:hypothetical protein
VQQAIDVAQMCEEVYGRFDAPVRPAKAIKPSQQLLVAAMAGLLLLLLLLVPLLLLPCSMKVNSATRDCPLAHNAMSVSACAVQ